MKKLFKQTYTTNFLLIISIMFSCQDDNLLENLDQNNLQACHDYALIEKTIIDIEN